VDACLHLALLEGWSDSDLVDDVRGLPAGERSERYAELIAEEISADTDEARWNYDVDLFDALPEGADDKVRSLAGIEAHPNLRLLHLPESEVDDLSPLAALPALELVWLGFKDGTDLTPLLSCERLRRLHTESGWSDVSVLKTLAARGVQVDDLLEDADTAAAPFDPILKLAVLDELQRSVELPQVCFFDENAFDDDNLARLMAVEIPQEQLDSIETLSWLGGGHTTAHMVWSQWDGESDEFVIRSLAGIEQLRNLRTLSVIAHDVLPVDQVAALRARGVTVREWSGYVS
jgi:hypothetical protein